MLPRMIGEQLDFLVIGAQKSGTTSLHEYLRRHPQLALPAGKEAPYFSHDGSYLRQDWDDYVRKTFPFAAEGLRRGTVTPAYMVGGVYDAAGPATELLSDERTVPRRIADQLPNVRLIALLRDPLERALSHHRMETLTGGERRPFDLAVEQLLEPAALEDSRRWPQSSTGYITWGEYGRLLSGYHDVFDAEQILVLYTAELARDPQGVLERIFRFLGVDPAFRPDNLGTRYRQGASTRRLSWLNMYGLQVFSARRDVPRRLWRALPERGRRQLDTTFNDLAYRTELWNRRRAGTGPPVSPRTAERLRRHYDADTSRLTDLLGVPPPWAPSGAANGGRVAH
jgi:hypothetical protein